MYTLRAVAILSSSSTRLDSVLEQLRRAILTGEIAPGERLLQVDLARRYGVSRIPLREALRSLHAEGLVVIEPNRGTICRPLEPKDLSDLYAVRTALEQLAIAAASERRVDVRAQTVAMRDEAIAATSSGDLARLIELDAEFHENLAESSGNEHLADALASCWSQIMRAMHVYFRMDVYPAEVWSEHVALAEMIERGDATQAVAALGSHIGYSRIAIIAGLKGMER